MKNLKFVFLLSLLTIALDANSKYSIKNDDGVTIYYNAINDREFEVTYDQKGDYSGNVVIPAEVTYDGITRRVTSIGNYAFYDCSSLTSVTIPNSVTSIGDRAFCSCIKLLSVSIPNSVLCIGELAFAHCYDLTSITIPGSVTTIKSCAFMSCYNITSITIPNGVTTIEDNLFLGCTGLTSVFIPDSITSIKYGAFESCSSLTSVTIPNNVTSIGEDAFRGCASLVSLTIGSGVTTIGDYAFASCKKLSDVCCLLRKPITIDTATFKDVPVHGYCDLHVPEGSGVRYKAMEVWKEFAIIVEDAELPTYSQYDLNQDGKISSADIQVIINEMKK